jgi:hypothetical protein
MQGNLRYRGALYKKVGLMRKRWRPSQFSREFVVPPHLKADWHFDAKNFIRFRRGYPLLQVGEEAVLLVTKFRH